MQFQTLSTFLALALAICTTTAATTCDVCRDGANINHIRVTAPIPLDSAPGICGGLWDNLKRFADCGAPSATWCGGDTQLEWKFASSMYCNKGMVESTWWEATKNEYGALACNYREIIGLDC